MKRGLLFLLFLCTSTWLFAQEPIRFGDREVYLEANVRPQKRGQKTSSLTLGIPTGEKLNVLVQFERGAIPYAKIKQKGIELGDYLGSNAYYAQVAPGSRPSDFVGTGLRAVVPIRGEWKVVSSLLRGITPEWAVDGDNLRVSLSWFKGITADQVKADLRKRAVTFNACSELLRNVEITATREQLLALAEAEYVTFIRWTEPPQEFTNREGAKQAGATVLRIPLELGGRGLTGKGVRIGIWDANVGDHVDYGNRVHRQEFELGGTTHGMHTTGSIVGSGLLNEHGRGMAPDAEIWTWNFNEQSNKMSTVEEMFETYERQHISLTSNSYGIRMLGLCGLDKYLNYTYLGNATTDLLAYYLPDLTHVFSAGNSQGECDKKFSHCTNYAKNIITVAAVNELDSMTGFSSFGPLLDGRMFPIISARGERVYSTVAQQRYALNSGTSMSCPIVTGHLALLTQRWMQLHGGALPYNYYLKALIANTARDAGNVGPDYKYGFGILDAVASVTAMESDWHHFAALAKGGAAQTRTITVPAGVKELRVTLCWNDPVVNKEYATGECPMINDLDLTVVSGTTTYYPYTLDAETPNAPAVTTKKNAVDNIEQVVVKNPSAGAYTLNVAGDVKQGEEQNYVVVWYFDYQKPELFSPLAGDVYSPEEDIYLRVENVTDKVYVELSENGGNSFKRLGLFDKCSFVKLPKEIAPTTDALLRVVDQNGVVVTMHGSFSIMSQTHGLKLEATNCSTSGWKLTWRKAADATKYEVLRADINTATYHKIGEVNAPATEFVIPTEHVKSERNIYSVQTVGANGIKARRSVAVIADRTRPAVLTAADLPFTETFAGYPLDKTDIVTGENISLTMSEALIGFKFPFMSQHIIWNAKVEAENWLQPFQQRSNVAALEVCTLDLTGIEKGTELQFTTYMLMQHAEKKPNGALLRLVVNGNEVKDVLGRAHITADADEHILCWDLSPYAGEKVTLALEAALEGDGNSLIIAYYQIRKKTPFADVAIASVNNPRISAKAQMKEEKIAFRLVNNSSVELRQVPVSVQVDGRVAFSQTVDLLKPFEDQRFSIPFDFSSVEAHKFNVMVRTSVANDAKAENNTASFEVYNMGETLTMPELSYMELMGMLFPIVPKITSTLTTPSIAFTDGRGALAPYHEEERAILKVLPADPTHTLQITFEEIALAPLDTLYVLTGNVSSELVVNRNMSTGYITGKMPACSFVSEATDGGLTFMMFGHNEVPGDGWKGQFNEIEMPDLWKLKAMTQTAGSDTNHAKIQLTVENLVDAPLYNVGLWVTTNGMVRRYEIPELKAKTETIYTLPEEIDKTAPTRKQIQAQLAKDGEVANNTNSIEILNDPIWDGGGSIGNPKQLYIAKVRLASESDTIRFKPSEQVLYMPEKKIPLYKSQNALQVWLSSKPNAVQAAAKIRVWVDLNNDNTLEDNAPELVMIPLVQDVQEYWISLDYSLLATLETGERRMRFMLATDANYQEFSSVDAIEWGSVADVTANVKAEASPHDYEVGLLSIENLKTGRALTNETPITVKLRNTGLAPLKTVSLSYKVDEGTTVTETLNCDLAPRTEGMVTFQQKADLDAVGRHKITATLSKADSTPDDNEVSLSVYKISPQNNDKLFGLTFEGSMKEGVLLPSVAKQIKDEATIEGWWKLDETQFGQYINGDGVFLASVAGYTDFADNTLAFIAGRNGQFTSKQPVVKPGQWQHIAVSMKQEKENPIDWGKTTKIEVYVDGQKVEMERRDKAGFYFNGFALNRAIRGQNAMFRIWKTTRTEQEIKQNMARSVRTAMVLPPECVGEYIYTEGEGKASMYGNDLYASIVSERDNVWTPIKNVIAKIEVEGQLIPVTYAPSGEAIATMPADFVNFNNVKIKFTPDWMGSKIMLNSTEITEDQVYDFSNADHKLHFTATKTDLFGVTLTQELDLKLMNDLSNRCELTKLTLPKAKNQGLKQDVVVENPEEMILLAAENESATNQINIKNVKVVVNAISENAKLYKGEDEIVVGSDLELDLSTPQTLRVVAANKRDVKFYTVQLSMEQEIAWNTEKIVRDFTNEKLPLEAKASSGLAVKYQSKNPAVATVDAYGNLITTAVGTTTIVATQEGNVQYKAAQPKEREIEVKRIPITIRMLDASMMQGEELPEFFFDYDGLQFEGSEYLLNWQYDVKLADGSVWNATMLPLEPGEYTVVPHGYTAPYESGNYTVTRTEGKLLVVAATNMRRVTFTVKDETNEPLAGATLQCGIYTLTTDAEGKAIFNLLPGDYEVLLTKDGYTSASQLFKVKGRSLEFELQLLKLVHTLTYQVDEHGILQGVAIQKVANGQNGEQVVAVPNNIAYRFKQWSDGQREAARADKGVTSDKTVTATFEPIGYKLTYVIGKGGTLVSGDLEQSVIPGGNGTPVEIKAEPGYVFMGWSDGVTTLTRTETNVKKDLKVEAKFFKAHLITWAEDFESGNSCIENWLFPEPNEGFGWTYSERAEIRGNTGSRDGHALLVDSYRDWAYNEQTSAISPWLSLAGRDAGSKVVVSFSRNFFQDDPTTDVAKAQYSFEDNVWQDGIDITPFNDGAIMSFEIPDATLGTHSFLRLRWYLSNQSLDAFLAIDDISVKYSPDPSNVVLRYMAAENGKLQKEGSAALETILEFTTSAGTPGAKVKAVPDDGYVFDKWSDANPNDERQDAAHVSVKAFFKPKAKEMYSVTYSAKANGRITGIAYQRIAVGEMSTPVVAVAAAGYEFLQWSDGSTMNPRTDKVTEDGKMYQAEFTQEVPVYTLTYIAGKHGDLRGELVQNVKQGASGTAVEALPDDGYHFVRWDDGNTDNPRIDANVQATKTYKALFEENTPPTYIVRLAKEGEGTLTVTGIEEDKLNAVPEGTELTAVAKPATGWKLKSLMAGDKDIKTDGKFTVTADVEVKAVFEKETAVDDAIFANVQVAPNPFNTLLRILSGDLRGKYSLINTQGIEVASGALEGAQTRINTTLLSAGVYLLRLTAENGAVKVLTVVKE